MATSSLTLRHRIPGTKASSEQASLRFLESFYPVEPKDHHVLVLSPEVELSPLFWQYLHYTILTYKYSSYGDPQAEDLLGISLGVPSTFLNGSGGFTQPRVTDMKGRKYREYESLDKSMLAPFMFQAPSASANLLFGEKWVTFHNFLMNRLAATHEGVAEKTMKLVSETEPAWLEYLLELMRARSWTMLFPASSLATVHNELAQLPEEYVREETKEKEPKASDAATHSEEEAFLVADSQPTLQPHLERDTTASPSLLQELLPFNGDLPELLHLPYLNYTGDQVAHNDLVLEMFRDDYVTTFRHRIGGCSAKDANRRRVQHYLTTDDLFCLPGMELEFDVGEQGVAKVAEAIAKTSAPPMEDAIASAKAAGLSPGSRKNTETNQTSIDMATAVAG